MSKHHTPPESFVNPPLAPGTKPLDRVSRIIRHLQVRKAGRETTEPWMVFNLQPGEFELLIARLKADESLWSYIEDKVRYNYFSRSGRFILRMPTTTQETFRSSIVRNIQGQFDQIATRTDDAAVFARNVRYGGSPRLYLPADEVRSGDTEDTSSKYDVHDPGAAFKHIDAKWPCIIIEVSFSQKERELNDLAEDYILGSDGNIRVVVGLNIEYTQSKKATFSVWQPQYIEHDDGQEYLISAQTVSNQVFRDDLGNLIRDLDQGLEIQLRDFATENLIKNSNAITQRIFIASSTLYDYVTKAEADAEIVKERRGEMFQLKPGAKKRRRQKTPLQELTSDDVRRFLDEEERDAKRITRHDTDYVWSSP